MSIIIWGYDVGGTTKVIKFSGNSLGEIWYAKDWLPDQKGSTPRSIKTPPFSQSRFIHVSIKHRSAQFRPLG